MRDLTRISSVPPESPEDGTCVSLFTMFVDTAEVREISIDGARDDDATGERETLSVELKPLA